MHLMPKGCSGSLANPFTLLTVPVGHPCAGSGSCCSRPQQPLDTQQKKSLGKEAFGSQLEMCKQSVCWFPDLQKSHFVLASLTATPFPKQLACNCQYVYLKNKNHQPPPKKPTNTKESPKLK